VWAFRPAMLYANSSVLAMPVTDEFAYSAGVQQHLHCGGVRDGDGRAALVLGVAGADDLAADGEQVLHRDADAGERRVGPGGAGHERVADDAPRRPVDGGGTAGDVRGGDAPDARSVLRSGSVGSVWSVWSAWSVAPAPELRLQSVPAAREVRRGDDQHGVVGEDPELGAADPPGSDAAAGGPEGADPVVTDEDSGGVPPDRVRPRLERRVEDGDVVGRQGGLVPVEGGTEPGRPGGLRP
jgi:hypothetical protein